MVEFFENIGSSFHGKELSFNVSFRGVFLNRCGHFDRCIFVFGAALCFCN